MRYVGDNLKKVSLCFFLFWASCLPTPSNLPNDDVSARLFLQNPQNVIPEEQGAAAKRVIAFDDEGCLSSAAQIRKQFFEKAIVMVSAITPHSGTKARVGESPIALEPPQALDLLSPAEGLKSILSAIEQGQFQTADLKLVAAEIVLQGHSDTIQGLKLPQGRIQVKFSSPFKADPDGMEKAQLSSCPDSLKVEGGLPKFSPPELLVTVTP